MNKNVAICYVIVAISFLVSIYFYPFIPDQMITHWDGVGRADGSMGKLWGLFFIPFIMFALAILFRKIPNVDPLKANIELFKSEFDRFVIILLLFFLSVQLVMILWNLGQVFDFILFFVIWIAVLFYYAGDLCKKSRRNWFIGIRTPWTLNSDVVWEKTNRLGGTLFQIYALIIFAGVFFPGYFLLFIVVPMILLGIIVVYYSYSEYQKELDRTPIQSQEEQLPKPKRITGAKPKKKAATKKPKKSKKK